MDSKKKPRRRSEAWFGKADRNGFMHRSWMKNQGYPEDLFDGRPVIGICNTWSELTPCNGHFRELAFEDPCDPLVRITRQPSYKAY